MLAEIDARDVPEIVVVNKADAADPDVLQRLLRREPHAVVVSARTGAGIERAARADRGRAAAARRRGAGAGAVRPGATWSPGSTPRARCSETEHTGEGTLIRAKVAAELAAELERYAVAVQR